MAVVEVDPGAVLPEHDHVNEQFGMVIEGTMHFRVGEETRTLGPGGIWQPIADAIKAFIKEDFTPQHVRKVYFWLAPAISMIPALLTVQNRFTSRVAATPELAMSGCSPGVVLAIRFPASASFGWTTPVGTTSAPTLRQPSHISRMQELYRWTAPAERIR